MFPQIKYKLPAKFENAHAFYAELREAIKLLHDSRDGHHKEAGSDGTAESLSLTEEDRIKISKILIDFSTEFFNQNLYSSRMFLSRASKRKHIPCEFLCSVNDLDVLVNELNNSISKIIPSFLEPMTGAEMNFEEICKNYFEHLVSRSEELKKTILSLGGFVPIALEYESEKHGSHDWMTKIQILKGRFDTFFDILIKRLEAKIEVKIDYYTEKTLSIEQIRENSNAFLRRADVYKNATSYGEMLNRELEKIAEMIRFAVSVSLSMIITE